METVSVCTQLILTQAGFLKHTASTHWHVSYNTASIKTLRPTQKITTRNLFFLSTVMLYTTSFVTQALHIFFCRFSFYTDSIYIVYCRSSLYTVTFVDSLSTLTHFIRSSVVFITALTHFISVLFLHQRTSYGLLSFSLLH